jgi:hypothetical protein
MKLPKCLKKILIDILDDDELIYIIFKSLHYFKEKTDNEIDDFVIAFLDEKFNVRSHKKID